MNNQKVLSNQSSYKLVHPASVRKNVQLASNKLASKLASKEALINKLKSERIRIRAQLVISSYVDNWPYIKVLPEKLRGRLLHKLRLIDEALIKANKLSSKRVTKKRRAKLQTAKLDE